MTTNFSTTPSPASPVKIAIIDDHELMRDAISTLANVATVGTFPTVEEFLAARPAVDVVVLDLWIRPHSARIAHMSGARAVKTIHDRGYRVLIYTSEERRPVLVGCLAAGADGVILKSENRQALAEAIVTIAAGEVVLTTALTGIAELFQRRGLLPVVTKTKLEVLRARARGEPFKSLAERLFISDKTAENYMREIKTAFRDYLRLVRLEGLAPEAPHSPSVIEQHLGLAPGDLLDFGPDPK